MFKVNEFWYTAGTKLLYRIDKVTDDGSRILACTYWSGLPKIQEHIPWGDNFGWDERTFDRRDGFMTGVYARKVAKCSK